MIHRVRSIGPDLHLKDGVRARPADPLDRNPNIGQVLGELSILDSEVNVIPNPLWRKFHEKLLAPSDWPHWLANSEKLAARAQEFLSQTARGSARPPGRTTEYHPRRTSAAPIDPPPSRKRIRKLSWDRIHWSSQIRKRWDPPSRSRAPQSSPSACMDGTGHHRARASHFRRK